MYALVVPVKVKPEMREKFLAAALDDSTCSVRDEPGCVRFDVLQDNTDPNKFFFYEVYRDEAAVEAHRAAPHYARWRAVASEVLAEPTNASRCTTTISEGLQVGARATIHCPRRSFTALFREVRDAGTMAGIVRRSCGCGRDPRGRLVGADLSR